jgi:DNA-binding transcriptional regulator YhcF (GntR family)
MSRDYVAGAVVLQKLRERIVSGCYLGAWQPGQRLPSIRTIAGAEGVDRKTAAAAYRHLQDECRVEVHPRSGVYLRALPLGPPTDPLERLHRQWLNHTYQGARSLGLDTGEILRLVHAVADVERTRLPVVECDWAQAELLAKELRERLGVRASPCLLDEVRMGDPMLAEAPVVVTTPYHSGDLALAVPGLRIAEVSLAPEIFKELRRRLARDTVVVVTATRLQLEKLRRGLEQHHAREYRERTILVAAEQRGDLNAAVQQARQVFLWPGAPDWVEGTLMPEVERFRPRQILSSEALSQVQTAVLNAAIQKLRVAVGTPAETAVTR